jgi:ABC-type lipoprotein release transport system permease subunit
MGGIISILPVVIRRVRANARLLVAVVVGAVLASAIMSTTAIYTDAIRDLGLSYAIRERGPDAINLVVRSTSQQGQVDTYTKNQEYIENTARQTFGGILNGAPTSIGRSATFYPTAQGGTVDAAESRDRGHLFFVTNSDQQIAVIEGQLPANTAASGPRAPNIEVAIGSETAQRLGITVGQRFDLHPFWLQDAEPVHARVVGIVEPKDPLAEFWVGQTDLFSVLTANWDTIPMLVTRETFFQGVVAYLPTMTNDFTTLLYVNTEGVNSRNAEATNLSLNAYGNALGVNVLRTSLESDLPEVLTTYDEKLFFTRVPLLVLVLQISAIVLYYLFMVSTMLVERQASEIALLKSRGATTAQVMRVYVLEGVAILAFALVLGPPIAATVVGLLGQTPPFQDLSGGSNLSVRLSLGAYLWAFAGAALAFVTLILPAYQATRSTVVQQRTASARPPKQTAFTRYYLDLVLVGLGAILLYQLDRRGSLVDQDLFGSQSVDPVVLLTPAFFILTVGLVFLRLFPLVLKVLAWVVARAQGAAILIGMWQLVRNPVHYSRLVLLLMLATAVGMFAASFGATLDRSYQDRAAYEAGANARLSDLRTVPAPGPDAMASTLSSQTGVEEISPVFRLQGSAGPLANRVSFDLLGVDPETFDDVAIFRSDFAGDSLGGLMEGLGPKPEQPGIALPADARWLGLWLNPVTMPGRFGLDIEVRDTTGRYFSYVVGPDDVVEMQPGWNLLVADLTRPGDPSRFGFRPTGQPVANGPYPLALPQAPFSVTSISLRTATRFAAPSGTLVFDDLHTTSTPEIGGLSTNRLRYDPDRSQGDLPGSQVVATFDSTEEWMAVQGLLPAPLNDQARVLSEGSTRGIELRWAPQQGQIATHGLIASGTPTVLKALASRGWLNTTGLKIGEVTQMFVTSLFVDVEIVGTYDLFPTLGDGRTRPSLIVDGSQLSAALNVSPRGPLMYPNELWMDADSDGVNAVKREVAGNKLIGTVTALEDLREAQKKDPLVAAGWEGILFISFAAILILSAIGFLIYSYLTAQRRTLEFAVLRTMGFSKKQIALVVGFEQLFVIGLGMAAGTLMGMRLGSLMIRYMGLTETGDEVVPPMDLHISWVTIGSAWLVLAAVFLVTIGAVVLLYSRLALHRVLRIGEA